MKRTILIGALSILAVLLLFFAGCTAASTEPTHPHGEEASDMGPPPEDIYWRDAELTDAVTGETFKINDLPKPILVESFAIWCPTCLKQQELMAQVSDATLVSINTDPNEDDALVKEHAQEHGYAWHFAVTSGVVTQSLIDEFGVGVINAPSVPILLLCDETHVELLSRGLKTTEELNEAIAGCTA